MPSDSLVPTNDPTLLFTGAGMNQFKDMFLGKGALPHKRVTTVQKCLRVPDLENVGVTPRHHTFFEMLGNFSFGDYFKEECIAWEWEFFLEEMGIPPAQMVVTVYDDDDEAYEIWQRKIGLPPERIFRFGEKENFWPAEAPSKGPNGPCGPCSEIYFDAFPDQPYPDAKGLTELPEGRFTEIGNCVFTQFDRQPDGSLAPLPQRNIDVGLGLERIAAVVAGVPNNFETDLFMAILRDVAERCGGRYGANEAADIRMRRIADHLRALVFCIADGALPSNEGRGYVVRKILRRASRDGYELGIEGGFLHRQVDLLGELMGDAYPEIRAHAGQCRALIKSEEEGFAAVYRRGVERLEEFLKRAEDRAGPESGAFAFELHDTHGFPVDITRQIMAERGIELDEDEFKAAMQAQRDRARAAMSTSSEVFADNAAMALRASGAADTEFCGYDHDAADSTLSALVSTGNEILEKASEGDEVMIVTAKTPFYAQSGGQIGDRGVLTTETGAAQIATTTGLEGYHLHHAKVTQGALQPGQACRLEVDVEARRATERNHTATHLLHAALKQVLGDHVSQAGSEVAPERLRFDYTHGDKLTAPQLAAIESLVNEVVMQATDVKSVVRALDEARADGFVAMFGEKYGDEVRTLAVAEFSKELCGGTHVRNSGNIGLFRITSDGAISAGTRRIEAVTGQAALELAHSERAELAEIAGMLKVRPGEVGERVAQLAAETKKLRKDLDKATAVDVGAVLVELEKTAVMLDGVHCAIYTRDGLKAKELQDLLALARKTLAPFAGVVFAPTGKEVLVAAAVSADVAKRLQAGPLVQAAAKAMGGGGGGKPEMAQGKGMSASELPRAEEAVRGLFADAGLAFPA